MSSSHVRRRSQSWSWSWCLAPSARAVLLRFCLGTSRRRSPAFDRAAQNNKTHHRSRRRGGRRAEEADEDEKEDEKENEKRSIDGVARRRGPVHNHEEQEAMDDATAFFKFNFSACPDSHQNGVKNGKKSLLVADNSDHQLPPPRQVSPSEIDESRPSSMESLALEGGLTLLKCRFSATADVAGVGKTDLVPGKYEGGLKLWECTIDLVNAMQREIKDGQLSFRGKRVLELGCGHGLPGIFAFLKGATTVHFQDFNAEVLKGITIPNVIANLEQDRARLKRDNGVVTAKTGQLAPDVHYYAGDWSNVYELLSVVGSEDTSDSSIQEDLSQASDPNLGLGDGDINGGAPPRPLGRRKSSSSRAFERALLDVQEGGYDIILMSETVYSLASLPKLYNVIKKCLRPPYGVLYMAAKKHYFGVGGGSRQFKALADEDGVLGAHLITEFADGSSNVREIWKFFFR